MKLLSIKAFCEKTNLSYSTVWRNIKTGRIQAVKVGVKAVRIPDTELEKFIQRYKTNEGKIVDEPDMTELPKKPENPIDII